MSANDRADMPPMSSKEWSLITQLAVLQLLGVRVRLLDQDRNPIATNSGASGFIRREDGELYLYTCWHVVAGFDPNSIQIPSVAPEKRRYLKLELQAADRSQDGIEVVGGNQAIEIDLYDLHEKPLWLQDEQHILNEDLNAVGIFVPFWHDIVKIALPQNVRVSNLQIVDETRLLRSPQMPVQLGERCLLVGFPYGYSALGAHQPTPVVLTRFVASRDVAGRRRQLLLDSVGARGMSGCPVFVERNDGLKLAGVYTGCVFPDGHTTRSPQMVTALGTVSDLGLLFDAHLKLVRLPSIAVPNGASS